MKLVFDKRIYEKAAVVAAAKDFKEFADVSVHDSGDLIEVVINKITSELRDSILGEFRNRVIFRTKVR